MPEGKSLILSCKDLKPSIQVMLVTELLSKGVLKGVGFGLTSGVITTLGVIIGLHSGTQSRLAVIVGITVVAVADAMSDALGIHVSEEAEHEHTTRELWESALFTFLSKLIIALSFIVPVAFLELYTAILASTIWGLALITAFSFAMARAQKESVHKVVAEHVIIALAVILFAHFLGDLLHETFIATKS
jgi:VIT1/CCC1 family predicted Fe2+/Mn2+ transporter